MPGLYDMIRIYCPLVQPLYDYIEIRLIESENKSKIMVLF